MTSIPLHQMPRWRAIAGEQIRTVGLLTRNTGIAFVSMIAVASAAVTSMAMNVRNMELQHLGTRTLDISLEPWQSSVFALMAFFYAVAVWEGDDRDHRGYHWMMPVPRRAHALTRVLAGWLWVLAATTLGLLCLRMLQAVSSMITGHPVAVNDSTSWIWLIPFTTVTLAYLVAASVMVGTRRPLYWIAGVLALYGAALGTLAWLGYRDVYRATLSVITGHYGLAAATGWQIDALDSATLHSMPSAARWLGAFALWGILSATLLFVLSNRRDDADWLKGAPNAVDPRGIKRYTKVILTIVAMSLASGIIATRFVKAEYEAKAIIWAEHEAKATVQVRSPEGSRLEAELAAPLPSAGQAPLDIPYVILDSVVRRLGLFATPANVADAPVLAGLSTADRFVPGNYTLSINDRATRWRLSSEGTELDDQGAVGDSLGRPTGLRWLPQAATLTSLAGRQVSFSLSTPREVSYELRSKLTAVPRGDHFLALTLTDVDPQRAARTLNAIAADYVALKQHATGAKFAVLDSAGAPVTPFKNTASRILMVALIIGVMAGSCLALVLAVRDARVRNSRTPGELAERSSGSVPPQAETV